MAQEAEPERSDRLSLSPEEERIVRALLSALRTIKHGSVQILVQDGRVVQIDTLEKRRFSYGAG